MEEIYCEDSYECLKCIDYYGVLNLRRDCQLADIQKAWVFFFIYFSRNL